MGEGFQFIEIVLFAMVAVFLILRLRSVLGRRTGNERPPPRPPYADARAPQDDKVVALPDRRAAPTPGPDVAYSKDPTINAGLKAVIGADRSFDVEGFLGGARTAYDMVLASFATGDTETLRALLDDDVYDRFRRAIADRETRGETLETTLVALRSAEIVEARLNGRTAEVTVKFVSELVSVTRDRNGAVVSGDPHGAKTVTDYWTFARDTRSSDPNWKLVATRSES
jgi:predicted lipid-binding transport protein (Tim44 family)